MLKLLVAGVAGLVGFFPLFWLAAWLTGSADIGAYVALPLGFVGIPALILHLWTAARRRPRVFGAVGFCLAAALLVQFVRDLPKGSNAYAYGQRAALTLLTMMLLVGLRNFFKRPDEKDLRE